MKKCSVKDCTKYYKWGTYCPMHRKRLYLYADVNKTKFPNHGLSKSVEHFAWAAIKDRCYNPNNKAYLYYGGRGIKVDERWRESFLQFYKDMGQRPSKDYSIDRINNNKDYSSDNCRWATRFEQGANQRSNHHITFNNKTKTLAQWSRELSINRTTLYSRLKRGWSVEKALGL